MHFELYLDESLEYRWRLRAANGQVIAVSGEGYKDIADCQHGMKLVIEGAPSAPVTMIEMKGGPG